LESVIRPRGNYRLFLLLTFSDHYLILTIMVKLKKLGKQIEKAIRMLTELAALGFAVIKLIKAVKLL
jgi:hypothetical protein